MNSNRGRLSPATSVSLPIALLLLALLSLAMPAAYAQVDRAVLEGTVSDPSGGVIVGASVKIVAVDTGLQEEQKTNSKGFYRFSGLSLGAYTATVNNSGFQTKVVEDIILRVGQTRTLDVALGVGAISEQIDVKASTGPSDRSSAEAATVIDSVQISELPNNGRDWASFTLLAPFAQDDGGGDQRTIRFAGRARDDNNFSLRWRRCRRHSRASAEIPDPPANFSGRDPRISREQRFVRCGVWHAGGRPGRRGHKIWYQRLARNSVRLFQKFGF